MEALAALGVAAAAIQFFEFARKTLKDYGDLRDGRPQLRANEFAQSERRLKRLTKSLNSRPADERITGEVISEHDETIDEILIECNILASELFDVLATLGSKAEGKRWRTFRQAIASQWKSGEIKQFERRIDSCQGRLVLHLLARMESKLDQHGSQTEKQLDRLEDSQAKVLEIVAFTHQSLLEASSNQQTEIVSAFLTLSNGEQRTVTQRLDTTPLEQQEYDASRLGQAIAGSGRIITLKAGPSERYETAFDDSEAMQKAVLSHLWFRQAFERYDMVKENHVGTFDWIWDDPEDEDDEGEDWDALADFIRSQDDQIYWINGKPGSGKTTLMKYINRSALTQECLQTWAGEGNYFMASFFFWILGPHALQKSIQGLLRSILHDILSKAPALIPAVLEELCREHLVSASRPSSQEPTETELLKWFRRLVSHTSQRFRLCLIIDGIDEYSGNYVELLNLLTEEASKSPYIKLIVSSRPIISCTNALSKYSGLRLQEHTSEDIICYIDDRLGQRLTDLGYVSKEGEKSERDVLLRNIAEKSAGVFLWVVLVVVSLLEGLDNGDNLGELRQRLQQLPPDLEDLYAQIVNKIPKGYLEQAASLFGIMVQGLAYETCRYEAYHVSALQLSFATDDVSAAINAPIREMTNEEQASRMDEVDRRIRSRCQGLLEMNFKVIERHSPELATETIKLRPILRTDSTHPKYQEEKDLIEYLGVDQFLPSTRVMLCVEFIHRTAVEFFETSLGSGLLSQNKAIIPKHAFLWSTVRMLKSYPTLQLLGKERNIRRYFTALVVRSLRDIKDADPTAQPMPPQLVNQFSAIVQYYWNNANAVGFPGYGSFDDSNDFVVLAAAATGHWTRMLYMKHVTAVSAGQKRVQELQSLGSKGPAAVRLDDKLFEELDSLQFTGLATMIPLPSYLESHFSSKERSTADIRGDATNLFIIWLHAKVVFMDDALISDSLSQRNSNWAWEEGQGRWLTEEITTGPFSDPNCTLISLFLASGADPNEIFPREPHHTVWTQFLSKLPFFMHCRDSHDSQANDHEPMPCISDHLHRLLQAFIVHGANLKDEVELYLEENLYLRLWVKSLNMTTKDSRRYINYDVLRIKAGRLVELMHESFGRCTSHESCELIRTMEQRGWRSASSEETASKRGKLRSSVFKLLGK